MSETTEQQWTIKRLLEWTTEYFAKSTAGSPRLEAEVLLAEALGCQRIDLYTRFDELPDDPVGAQDLGDAQGQVGRGDPLGEFTAEVYADDLRNEERHRLAEHAGFRLDSSHPPTDHAEAVDHGRVGVGPDEGVGVVDLRFEI